MKEKKLSGYGLICGLQQQDLGIDEIFTEDVVYTESWGPQV